jgi:pimeloyl-ACP methyl ester carboxylesterase
MYTEQDPINPASLFEGTEHWVEDLTLKRFPGTHWMPEESPDLVTREIRAFLDA